MIERSPRATAVIFAACAVALLGIAALSPAPNRVTDRDIYERTAAERIVPDCSDLHCFRVLVAWGLGVVPGPSTVKWKAYAALANAAAAAAVYVLALQLALDARVALFAAVISAFGFGALYTLHDPFTSDPLMFAAGPFLTSQLLAGSVGVAALLASVGVLAKEFAAAPLYICAIWAALARRWMEAGRALIAANLALIVWAVFVLVLTLRFNYWFGDSASANVTGGAWLLPWLARQSARGIVSAMFNEFGALYVLAPVGLVLAPRPLRRFAVAAVPVALVLAYVQQPDRALWNFHYLVSPLAALVLAESRPPLAWATIATFGVGNLRVGAQLPIAGLAHVAIAASVVLALAADLTALRRRVFQPGATAVEAPGVMIEVARTGSAGVREEP